MLRPKDKNLTCKYLNTLARPCDPSYSFVEEKPFGSEMRCGRGVCDTDKILVQQLSVSCKINNNNNNKLSETTTEIIDEVTSNGSSEDEQKPLIVERNDAGRDDKKLILQRFLEYRTTSFDSPFEFETLDIPCDEIFSELETPIANSPNVSTTSSILISETNSDLKESEACYEEILKRESSTCGIKPPGPFTEPMNPGKQMKLGEPYEVRIRVRKDFYKDF